MISYILSPYFKITKVLYLIEEEDSGPLAISQFWRWEILDWFLLFPSSVFLVFVANFFRFFGPENYYF
jgi:hypothetical protein